MLILFASDDYHGYHVDLTLHCTAVEMTNTIFTCKLSKNYLSQLKIMRQKLKVFWKVILKGRQNFQRIFTLENLYLV